MQLHILASDGTHITETNDVPVLQWLTDWDIPHTSNGTLLGQPDPREAGKLSLLMADILVDVVRIVRLPDKPRNARDREKRERLVADMERKCATFCLNNPVVMQDFNERSSTHDLFVKIFDDHVEAGWQPKRDRRRLN